MSSAPTHDLAQVLGRHRLLPVAVLDDVGLADGLGRLLCRAGLPLIEITMRTAAAAAAIARLRDRYPAMAVGAGTVLSGAQAQEAVAAGAQFLVAPGFSEDVVSWAESRGIPLIPGVLTPSEMQSAMARGHSLLKIFPADAVGGPRFLRAIASVYPGLHCVPSGGITAANLGEYLALPNVAACAASWLVDRMLLEKGAEAELKQRIDQALAVASTARSRRADS